MGSSIWDDQLKLSKYMNKKGWVREKHPRMLNHMAYWVKKFDFRAKTLPTSESSLINIKLKFKENTDSLLDTVFPENFREFLVQWGYETSERFEAFSLTHNFIYTKYPTRESKEAMVLEYFMQMQWDSEKQYRMLGYLNYWIQQCMRVDKSLEVIVSSITNERSNSNTELTVNQQEELLEAFQPVMEFARNLILRLDLKSFLSKI